MSRLIVYAGPNGAGKSTLRDIGGDIVDVVVDPDRIARELAPQIRRQPCIRAVRRVEA